MTEADFLEHILRHPDDEVARLAYADWLLEQGEPAGVARAEFIHVQVQLARRTEGGGSPADWADAGRVPALKAREQALLAGHGAGWARGLNGLVDHYQFHKGFIEHVTMDANRFAGHAERLFEHHPVRRVRLVGGINARVAGCPWLGRLDGLDLSRSQMGDHGLRVLLGSPHLGRLTWLDLSHCYLTDQGAEQLARSPLLARLTYLNLGSNLLSTAAVQRLLESPHWGGTVGQLVLDGNYYIDARVRQFLGKLLQGSSDPALLRSILQTESRQEREYTNARVRDLAQQAGRDPARAAGVLARGLDDGRRKVRSAAAQMLAQLGAAGGAGVPKLVQRLFEKDRLVRDHVAPALARLLPELHPDLQRWLCVLANPLTSPATNLRDALASPQLPPAVLEPFAAVCARRLLWWKHVAQKGQGPAPVPEPGSYRADLRAVKQAVTELQERAGRHASRHAGASRRDQEASEGSAKEAAWLLARLTELLLGLYPAPPAPPAAAGKRRK
jgi:uncharacterized protein (TIGR02996 family)